MIWNSDIHREFFFGITYHKNDFKDTDFLECGNYKINVDSGLIHDVLTFNMWLFNLEQTDLTWWFYVRNMFLVLKNYIGIKTISWFNWI